MHAREKEKSRYRKSKSAPSLGGGDKNAALDVFSGGGGGVTKWTGNARRRSALEYLTDPLPGTVLFIENRKSTPFRGRRRK